LPVNVVRAVALKFAVAAPAAKVIDAGTVTEVLSLASVTVAPPAGAACVRLTVQLLTPPWPRTPGLQFTPETRDVGVVSRLIVEVCELLPSVAVTIAF
jgi:hypothetical protein